MTYLTYLSAIHIVGMVAGPFARKRRVPAGNLIGAMVAVVLLNLLVFSTYQPEYPPSMRIAIQVISGIVVGKGFTRSDIMLLHHMVKPAAILVSMLLGFNVLFAASISYFTNMSLVTALFATAPAGVAELALIATEFGADTQQVALLQMFRFAFVVSFFPFVIKRIINPNPTIMGELPKKDPDASAAQPIPENPVVNRRELVYKSLLTALVAVAGAVLFLWLNVPAGGIFGSLTAVILLSAAVQKAYFPDWGRTVAQVLAGCFIGSQINLEALLSIRYLLLPMALLIAQVLFMAFATAWVLQRATKMERATSLFSCIPGGIAEMGIISGEMGLDVPKVVVLHTCRVFFVIIMMPMMLHLLY